MLEFNEVGDVGVVELAKAMEEGHLAELEELNLKSTKITGVGLQALVRAVSTDASPKLRSLNVDGNDFEQNGACLEGLLAGLVRADRSCGSRTSIYLRGRPEVGHARNDDVFSEQFCAAI